ncbi:MAG TPA: SIMPL domain-containing protein [Acetobacteraceae bacterium]|nr:SIMPL domain-containing protein [Acetobacteraceae bacterium]
MAALALLTGAGPARAETLLHLSATATVTVQPDELAASLSADADEATPQAAQARVNAAITAALATARAVEGASVSTGSYSVWHVEQPHPAWQASQGISLHGADGGAILALVGRLQTQGLAVASLGWRVSAPAERRAHEEAEREAIAALRGRAAAAAKLLGLRFQEFRSVDLDPGSRPLPMGRMMAAAVPMPNAVASPVAISATVTAEAALAP